MSGENKQTLLLVEDEAIIAMVEKKQLENLGYNLHHASNGEDAVKTILENKLPIDLILMDIDLGDGIDGTKAAEQILKQRDIPVVFLSSHTEPEIVGKTETITSYGYVVKNSGIVVLDASIKMAFKLFEAKIEAKKHEDAMRISETKLQATLNKTPFPIAVVDLQDDKIFFWSHSALELFGHTAHTASEWYQIAYPDPDYRQNSIERWKPILEKARNTGQTVNAGEYRVTCKDGSERICEIYASIIPDSLIVTFNDITDRKWAEETLRESEIHLSNSQRIARLGSWRLDVASNQVMWTEELYNMYGFDPTIPPPPYTEHMKLFTPGSWERLSTSLASTRETGIPYELELETVKKDGSNGWMWVRGEAIFDKDDKITGIWGAAQDITERKLVEEAIITKNEELDAANEELNAALEEMEASNEELIIANHELQLSEEALQESELQYRNMTNAGLALIWKSGTDKLCNYFNDPWLYFTGRTMEQEMGNGWTEGVHPEDYDRCVETYVTAFDKREYFEMEYRLRHSSGEYKIILDLGTPNFNSNGEFIGYIGHCFDISERKQAEDKIKHQLSEKEMLLKEVHHRVKNNIASIEGLLSLQADSADNAEAKSALFTAISRIQGIRVLYEKLLISEEYQNVSVKDYTESLIDSLISVFPESKNITIKKKIADFDMNSKKVIPVGIIINELLTNIFKYAFKDKNNNIIFIEFDKKDTKVTLTIQDNGIGIDERVIENKMPGFGLIIVKMLAEQLKGTYAIENDNGTKSILQFEI